MFSETIDTPIGSLEMWFVTSQIADIEVEKELDKWNDFMPPVRWCVYQSHHFDNIALIARDTQTNRIVMGILDSRVDERHILVAWIYFDKPQKLANIDLLHSPFCFSPSQLSCGYQSACSIKNPYHACNASDNYDELEVWIESILRMRGKIWDETDVLHSI